MIRTDDDERKGSGLLLTLPVHVEIAHAGVARALLGLLHREPSLNEHGLENKK